MKKVLIIGTSPRKNGNSNRLAQEFEKGAKSAGNEVETVYLCDKSIGFCKGCMACQRLGKCVINDDAVDIAAKMKEANVIVWATPIYYYEMSAQMKTMIDRGNPLYGSDYKFTDVYLLTSAADYSENAMDGAIKGLEGWVACFGRAQLKGVVKGVGLEGIGAVEGTPYLQEAYNLGQSV